MEPSSNSLPGSPITRSATDATPEAGAPAKAQESSEKLFDKDLQSTFGPATKELREGAQAIRDALRSEQSLAGRVFTMGGSYLSHWTTKVALLGAGVLCAYTVASRASESDDGLGDMFLSAGSDFFRELPGHLGAALVWPVGATAAGLRGMNALKG